MEGAGLLEFWLKQYSDDPTYCLTKIQRQMKEKSGKRRLTLNNLSGAFLVLFIGYVLSIIAFILELCTAWRQRRYKNEKAVSPRKSQLHHLKPIAITDANTAATVETSAAVSTALNVVPIVVPKNSVTLDVEKLAETVTVEVFTPATYTAVTPPKKLTTVDALKVIDLLVDK